MKIKNNQYLISPSDLNNFVTCKYIIKNNILFLTDKIKKKKAATDQKIWQEFGLEHEEKHFDILKKKYKTHIIIRTDQTEQKRFEDTQRAIKDGIDLIYHAYFIENNFRGEVDFLIKVKKDPKNFHYEVYDTKITRSLKPRHVLQITGYSYLLSKTQGHIPDTMYLIDGNDEIHSFKTKEYLDYFTYSKNNFDMFLNNVEKENVYPEKCKFCKSCEWEDVCVNKWDEDNYINQVARIIGSQTEKLKKENINTIEKLAKSSADKIKSKINIETKERLIAQAILQEEKRRTNKSRYEVLPQAPGTGLYKIPKSNEGDIFYDIEGFPKIDGKTFYYLHGFSFLSNKEMSFKYFWAKNFHNEYQKEIFVNLINFLKKHMQKYPDAFIYHYNTYEETALKELSERYSSSFPEGRNFVDELLASKKLVDLYKVSIKSIRTTEKKMTLKTLEVFYKKFSRQSEIFTAGDSIKLFDKWLKTNNEKDKNDIISYNKDDCYSTYELRELLVNERRKDDTITWFDPQDETEESKNNRHEGEERELELLDGLDKVINKDNKFFISNLKNMVGFYKRERKPGAWDHFNRLDKSHEELEDDNECIANCVLQSTEPLKHDKKLIFIYKFNDQEFKLKKDGSAKDLFASKKIGNIFEIQQNGNDKNILKIIITEQSFNKLGEMPSLVTFGPDDYFPPRSKLTALNKYIESIVLKDDKKYTCITSLLKKEFPNILEIEKSDPLINEKDDLESTIINVAKGLQKSYLLIQGPPGSGKTYISAKMIIALLKDNKKIGISSNSHSAINTLLKQIESESVNENFTFNGIKKYSNKKDKLNGEIIKDVTDDKAEKILKDNLLFAGTAWMFSNDRYNQKLDYLFIDEGGQVSLADTIAMATSCKNLILIGDQMQLSQPIKGIHLGYSGKSALDYLLENYDTIPSNRGVFLPETRRLTSKICDYISPSFYDSRLKPHEITKERVVNLGLKNIGDKGIFYIPVNHKGCFQQSDEESDLIKKTYSKILGTNFKDEDGESKLTENDIMVLAPFNIQVNNIVNNLNKDVANNARVGTIDNFQGQQAKVVFISMTCSNAENLPRNKEFFFSRNRLNVAISRAQCVVIILFNKDLLLSSCNKIEEMKLMNNFCKLLEFETNYK